MSTPTLSAATPAPLVARDVTKTYADRVVLDGLDVTANPGRPLGIVGENGVGKSTLLRLLAGTESADAGSVSRPDDLVHLGQDPDFGDASTLGEVLARTLAPLHDGVRRLERLALRLDDETVHDEYAATLAWAEQHDAWEADRRAELAAARLGLAEVDPARQVAAMSGGQRSRLALTAMVARRPACVLLDEPTNHLDDAAVEFLESYLRELPGVVVVASHDRTFLDNVCAEIVDLDPMHLGVDGVGGNRFTGGYTDYLAHKSASRRRWEEVFSDQQGELNRLRVVAASTGRRVAHNRPPRDNDKYVHHFKGENVARTVRRRVRDAEQRIEVLERERVPKPPAPLRFTADLGSRRPTSAVVVRDLLVTGRVAVPRLDVRSGEHVLVTGANGSGKSTLLKVVAGEVAPTSGTVDVSARRVGHLPQDVAFSRPDASVRDVYHAATGSPRPLGELGLVHPRELVRPVGQLSAGQQRRLALAILVARGPDLLLLDEPTNHISLTLAEELEQALRRSPATVLVASHDRWLRRGWDGPVLALG